MSIKTMAYLQKNSTDVISDSIYFYCKITGK